jgi:hypothetical protein
MTLTWIRIPAAAILFAAATGACAQSKCSATGQMAGQAFSLANCEAAIYEGGPGVTIWFSSTPITAEELAFCPGGGSAVPSPRTAKNIELGFKHATVSDLGPQDQWVFDSASDKQIKFDALAGELKRGGKLTGKVTGAIAGKKPPFTWDLQFDLVLPQRAAGAGPSC